MNRFSPATPAAARAGFTLIELLVVISIIAVLAAILLPVYNKVQYASRKVQVINDKRSIQEAVVAYYNDNRQQYPISNAQLLGAQHLPHQDTVYGDHVGGVAGKYSTADMFDILRAITDDTAIGKDFDMATLNPTQTVYWTGQLVKNPLQPRDGITTQDVTIGKGPDKIRKGAFVDPWGQEYVIWVDAYPDGDLTLSVGGFYNEYKNSTATSPTVHTGLAPLGIEIGSLGADGKWGNNGDFNLQNSDDIVSFQH